VNIAPALALAVANSNLDTSCAVELCLERALVVHDLAAVGYPQLYERLLTVAGKIPVRRALPAAKARYLQMLIAARDLDPLHATADGASGAIVDVPYRLFPRVTAIVDEIVSAGVDHLAEALTLEIAAVADGRTMSEWTALAALRLSR
jgi:hypothetical protein